MTQKNDKDPFSPDAGASANIDSGAPQAPPSKLAARMYSLLLFFLLFFGAINFAIATNLFRQLRQLEAFLLVLLVTLPLTIAVMAMVMGKLRGLAVYRHNSSSRYSVKTYFVASVLFAFFAIEGITQAAATYINGAFDHSPLTPHTLTVISKSYSADKHGHRHYYAVVDSPAQPMLPFSLDGTERLPVDATLYHRIEAGVTEVILDTHDGYFGLPWIAAYEFTGPFAETAPVSPNRGDAQLTDVPAFDTTIEPLTPDTIKREYWPNGALKQEEPMVRGQIHGLARYWFDNGKPYGEIPWKQGRKHGRFMLYRPDGTPEQSLSYKDGQPHGVLAWYNRDGSLQQKWLYVDGDAKKRLN